jgi:iron complex outermembrane receptor protein
VFATALIVTLPFGSACPEGLAQPLPPQPLESALAAFSRSSVLQIVYSTDDARNVMTKGAPARLSDVETLSELLRDTGLTFEFVNERTLAVAPVGRLQAGSAAQRLGAMDVGGGVRTLRIAAVGASKAAQAGDAGGAGSALTEVIVTASRREESLQQVPISVTALTAESLAQSGIDQSAQLGSVTPGLILARNTSVFQPTIRGVGSRASTAGDESNIAMYIDGVYQPETFTGAFDLLEIDRVEVLRGPQGTLFGRNSTGGLINVITADPKYDFAGNATVRAGSFDERSARAYVTGGLTDRLAANVAALYAEDGGFIDDLLSDKRLGDRESIAARGKLLFEASDRVRAILTVNYADQEDQAPVAVSPIDRNTVGASVPGAVIADGPWEAALSFDPYFNVQQRGASLRLQFDLGAVDFESTSSYQKNQLHLLTDSDASPARRGSVSNTQSSENYSQEFRVIADGNEQFKWQAGVFGFMNMSRYEPFTVMTTDGAISSSIRMHNRTQSLAAFAEGVYSVTEALKLTAGARYTDEWRELESTRRNAAGVINGQVDADTSFNQFTPRVSLQYRMNERSNAYASYSRGFKSGVFNTASVSSVPVKPEVVDAYEIGFKSDVLSWLRTNAAVFYYQYEDIQLSQRDPNGASILQNAGKATMKGGELEVTAALMPSLDVRMGIAVLDGTFDEFAGAAVTEPLPTGGGNRQIFIDASGKDVIRAPSYTVSLGLAYNHDFSTGRLTASTNVYRSDKMYWDYLNRLSQPAYTLVAAQLGWTLPNDRWRIVLAGDNLTDEEVRQNVVTSTLADYASYLKPRNYSISLIAEF